MHLIQAGKHKFLHLDLDRQVVCDIASQLGFEMKLEEGSRSLQLDLAVPGRETPLLLFDAADPGNLGWFSRCQFYVDGGTGQVMQTPLSVANRKDHGGYIQPNAIRVQIAKELPASYQLPGKQPVSEQLVYGVLYSFLSALLSNGVAVCGGCVIRALAGRTPPSPINDS